ncbi:MAG: 5-amino-6-(D-ribitylamino)uracil--L-tyrosine 4-hydroxyphenyl transferase CofH [Deltaproteobacteria bacterium]|nr:5-amino-6-(D-ribitylamino)uracil--L-tyrosine 4-hydroxyphenyl transferase CofH [Deltaproteobacteria bacterium]MBI3075616.1 5-amino-6-(D-ribitylamino)uracil--L-tyrosine 4-hydroxyphenyl transferase CofH [Deltaproteobacteria bacterium]
MQHERVDTRRVYDLHREPVDVALRGIASETAGILDRALAGKTLEFEEGLHLATTSGAELQALIRVADEVRRQDVGDTVTYVVNRNINFTNICIIGCKFCAFSTGPNDPEAYNLDLEEIGERAAEAWACGATEVCVQGGLPREWDGYQYREILRAIKARTPEMHIHAFSPMEVTYGVEKTGLPVADYLAMLRESGLGSLPGTAAEILDSEVRALLSRRKVTVEQWVDVITTAHRLGIPTTSTLMYGHVERPEHWVRQLLLLRGIQQEYGGFTEFVPLGFVHFQTDLFRKGLSRPGPTLEEHLKIHALGRIMLRGFINNVQVSWVKLGREVSQLCLLAGANDYGGTLMEENISRLAGATAGQYLSPEEFQERIREVGRTPAERSTTYQLLKVFHN